MDVMSPEKRSALMSRIRSRGTGPELTMARELRRARVRFRRWVRAAGVCEADFVLPGLRIAVMVHGDFWHGWRFPAWSGKLNAWWRAKIERNRARDRRQERALRRRGWRVLRVWEHEIRRDAAGAAARVAMAAAA